jgi:hypothetical protein
VNVECTFDLPSLDELKPPEFDQGNLNDAQKAQKLIIADLVPVSGILLDRPDDAEPLVQKRTTISETVVTECGPHHRDRP